MKHILLCTILLLSFSDLVGQSLRDLFKSVDSSVVVIHVKEPWRENGKLMGYERGIGSGVIISEEGEILTASHVIQNASQILVECPSGEMINAEVVRLAKSADVALIKLRQIPADLKVAKIGDSDKVQIGDQVAIIGSPHGLYHSLSSGIISGRHINQSQTSGFIRNEFFQTDAAINPGNSGGPMLDMSGEVIGIVSYILSESGGFEGLGFAATSNIAEDLLIDSDIPFIGIDGYFLDKKLARTLNVSQDGGLMVQKVSNLSPAAFAGIEGGELTMIYNEEKVTIGGDIILQVGDIILDHIDKIMELRNIYFDKSKSSIPVRILRAGKIIEMNFEI